MYIPDPRVTARPVQHLGEFSSMDIMWILMMVGAVAVSVIKEAKKK